MSVLQGMMRIDELQHVLAYQHQTGALFTEAVQQLGLLDAPQLAVLTTHVPSTLLLGGALCLQGHLSVADLEAALGDFAHYHTTGELRPCGRHPRRETMSLRRTLSGAWDTLKTDWTDLKTELTEGLMPSKTPPMRRSSPCLAVQRPRRTLPTGPRS